MNYWLVKFAPFRYSWQDILRNGKFEIYSVRSPQARDNLQKMQLNDWALFYHSQTEKQVMGIMKIIKTAHQDFTTNDPQWVSVTFEPMETLKNPVPLLKIKQTIELREISLVKQPRLSVMKLNKNEFEKIVEIAKL
jgi:predicted RNA-binding protein with PUA-like domain